MKIKSLLVVSLLSPLMSISIAQTTQSSASSVKSQEPSALDYYNATKKRGEDRLKQEQARRDNARQLERQRQAIIKDRQDRAAYWNRQNNTLSDNNSSNGTIVMHPSQSVNVGENATKPNGSVTYMGPGGKGSKNTVCNTFNGNSTCKSY